ncbi:MAG: hypothetical protein WBO10_01955 [Pyrinomonadaceae bacterium]
MMQKMINKAMAHAMQDVKQAQLSQIEAKKRMDKIVFVVELVAVAVVLSLITWLYIKRLRS